MNTGRVRAQREGQNISINFYDNRACRERRRLIYSNPCSLSFSIIIILHIIYTGASVWSCAVPSHYIKNTGCLRCERSPVGRSVVRMHRIHNTECRARPQGTDINCGHHAITCGEGRNAALTWMSTAEGRIVAAGWKLDTRQMPAEKRVLIWLARIFHAKAIFTPLCWRQNAIPILKGEGR
jgi:hypothetical protein